jgi:hypothetical protein
LARGLLRRSTSSGPSYSVCVSFRRNTLGRAATVVSPFVVGALMVDYGLPGVIWLMIGLLVAQIIAVYFCGVEPARRSLEGLDPKA